MVSTRGNKHVSRDKCHQGCSRSAVGTQQEQLLPAFMSPATLQGHCQGGCYAGPL